MKMNKLGLVAAMAMGSLLGSVIAGDAQDQKAPAAQEQKATAAQETRPPTAQRAARGRPMGPEQRAEFLHSQLQLTDAQKAKVTALFEAQANQRRDIFANTNLSAPDKRQKAVGMMEEERKQLKTILTPEQFEKWDAMRPQRGRGPGGPGGPGGAPAAAPSSAPAAGGPEKKAEPKKAPEKKAE